VLERALQIEGFTKQSELELLQRLAADMPAGAQVVEVGSWLGRSTTAIAAGLEKVEGCRLYAVDTFGGDPGWAPLLAPTEARREFERNTADIPFLEVVQQPSVQAAEAFEDASLDWVFIDALHDYHSVRDDIAAWGPKLKHRGLISGHDYGRAGVTDAVLARFDDVTVEHSIWHTRARPKLRPVRTLKATAKVWLRRGS
jgi:predicted O-methyltransferase YrrM